MNVARGGDAQQHQQRARPRAEAPHCHLRFRARRGGAPGGARSPKGGRVGFGKEPRSGLFAEVRVDE